MKRISILLVGLVGILLGTTSPVSAQTASGVIEGTVSDVQGAVLPGVSLTVRSVETGIVRTTTSQEEGRYRVAALPPGHYDLSAELPGFAKAEFKDITLTIGMERLLW